MAFEKRHFLIVGGGKMGEALLSGWIASHTHPADSITFNDVTVVEPTNDRRMYLNQEFGVTCVADVADIKFVPEIVVLAVKPQVMGSVLKRVSSLNMFAGGVNGPLFISIAAGLTTTSLEAALPLDALLVRVMPNMPLAIGAGASGVCGGSNVSLQHIEYVANLFGCLGCAVIVDESDIDIVCALSGSGPAYVAIMIEALRDAAAAHGLDAALAEQLALQTVLGTARLISETNTVPAEVRESICSPGGTTLAALDAMAAHNFNEVFKAGIDAAIARAKELAKC